MRAVARFEIVDWTEEPYEEVTGGPVLSRVTVGRTFHGQVEADSVAIVLTCQTDLGEGYVASERIVGSVHGRPGTFVVQHGRITGLPSASFGHVVPGSATGELQGLHGTAWFSEEETDPTFVLDYSLG